MLLIMKMIIIMIIMNMQNKLYIIQFSHCLMTDSQPVPKQLSQNPELTNLMNCTKKTELPEKFELPDKKGFQLMEKEK